MDTPEHRREPRKPRLTMKRFYREMRMAARMEWSVTFDFPDEGYFVVKWRRTPGGMYDPNAKVHERRVAYREVSWDTIELFKVIWKLGE